MKLMENYICGCRLRRTQRIALYFSWGDILIYYYSAFFDRVMASAQSSIGSSPAGAKVINRRINSLGFADFRMRVD